MLVVMMLNSVIKFDLHIHSKASAYKESEGIVDQSTKENIHVLLTKLEENKVALFSITDHNCFDAKLYQEINQILHQPDNPYPNVKAVLAGVEFDVKLDDTMKKCHIIAIFDTKDDSTKIKAIEESLQGNCLTDVEAVYSKSKFEDILSEPVMNLRNICNFIELEFSEVMIPSKNDKMPFGSQRRKRWYPLNTKVNDKYLQQITKDDLKIINKECADYIKITNYELMK